MWGGSVRFVGSSQHIDQHGKKDYGKESSDIPAELQDRATRLHEQVIEAAAEADDELIMKYLDGEELAPDEIHEGLSTAVTSGKVVPVLCGSATRNIGVSLLQDAIVRYLPSPAATVEKARKIVDNREEDV